MSEEIKTPEVKTGAFNQAILRSSKEIKRHRAESVSEGTQLAYKRRVEDYQVQLNNLLREQQAMLDLSPENATSLMVAKNFNPEQFVAKDVKLDMDIYKTEVKLRRAKARYETLFGPYSADIDIVE